MEGRGIFTYLITILALLFVLADSSIADEPGWIPGTPMLSKRTGPGVALGKDGLIYAIGGVSAEAGDTYATNTAERFSESTGKWEYIASMSQKRHTPGAVTDSSGRIWVVGGHAPAGLVHDTVERYNPSSNLWTTLSSRLNTKRTNHGIAITKDDYIYIFGGYRQWTESGWLASTEKYNPQTGSWTYVASMNQARTHPAVAMDQQGRIYACGGEKWGGSLSTVERYNPSLDKWEYVSSLPEPMGNPAGFTLNGEIYVVGGWQSLRGKYTDACYIYSPGTNTWRRGPRMYEEVGINGAVVGLSGKVYLIGGEGPAIQATNRVAILSQAQPLQITGYIRTSDDVGIAGVTMTGWPGTEPVTGDNGYYSGTVPYGWSGTITPSKSGYTFNPTSKPYSNVTSDESNENYIGTPPPSWSFVQITDTHIGATFTLQNCKPKIISWDTRENLAAVLRKVIKEVNPVFIVNTGDIADYGCIPKIKGEDCPEHYKSYSEAIKLATDAGVRVYNIPGNHDQLSFVVPPIPCSSFPSCFKDTLNNTKNRFISGRTTFWDYDDSILFVTFDTGNGNCAGALTQEDIDFLKGLNKQIPKIILTHHPAVADDSEIPWCEPVCNHAHIVDGQADFLQYCEDKNNNVRAVLSGHTHTNHSLAWFVDKYIECLGIWVDGEWYPWYPLYIQTGTVGKAEYPVFRKIDVAGGEVKINDVTQFTKQDLNNFYAKKYSPGNLHVYDSNWRHTGYDPVNGYERGIPDSVYFSHYVVEDENGVKVFPEEVMIFDPCDNYLSRLVGTETGSYRLEIGSIKDANGVVFEANDIPTLPGAIHDFVVDWNAFSRDQNDQNAVTIVVDEDGNGVPEKTITSDGKLTGDEFVSEWPKLNGYVRIQVGEAGYDHQKKRLGVNVTVTNTSGETLGIPLWVVIESVSEPNVTLADANGVTSKDKNYADFSELLLNDRKLDPGESITKRIYFYDPDGVRFTFKPSVRGVILSQGEGSKGGMADLARLSGHWLGDEPAMDVAPPGGDGIVNLRDFAVLAEKWLDF